MSVSWIDSHCHLDATEFDADRAEVAKAAREAGVAWVVPAVAASNFDAVARTCAELGGWPAWGIHPLFVAQSDDADLERLRQTLITRQPVAVGEIGLDFYLPSDQASQARQRWFFEQQLKIARDLDLPVLLHVRGAVDAVLGSLRRIKVKGGIAHAFNGSGQQAQQFIDLGFKLGFGGAMTWQRANKLRRLAAELPLSSLVLETDAPDIPPEFIGRTRNSPAYLPRIAQTLADLRGLSLAAVAAATTENVRGAGLAV